MIVSELVARFGLSTDKASFARADQTLQGMVSKARLFVGAMAGVLAVREIASFVSGLMRAGAELHDTSIKTGIATAALQEYRFAANQAGVDNSTLETSMRFLSRSAFDAATGGKETAGVYKRLGINVKGVNGEVKSAEVLFSEVAEGLSKTENQTEKTALAMKIFGRGGAAILPMLADGAEGIEKLRQEARDLGGGFDEEFIKRADELDDNLQKLKFAGLGFKNMLGNALFPLLDRGVTKLIDWSKGLGSILKGSKFLEIALMGLAAVSVFAGIRALIPWLPFLFSFLTIAAAITVVIALIDDIHMAVSGGKSLIIQYLNEWFGFGVAEDLVTRFSIGVDTLKTSISNLLETGNPLKAFMGMFKGAFETGQVLGNEVNRKEQIEETEAEIARLRASTQINSKTGKHERSGLADALERDLELVRGQRTASRGMNAPLALDPSIPRTAGRGMGSQLQAGSAGFSNVSQAAVSPILFPEFSGPKATPSTGSSAVHNTANVTVNAHTGANPEEIGRIAAEKVQEKMTKQARNVQKALVNRPAQ